MPDLFLRIESVPIKGSDCSKVHFYRLDSNPLEDVWEGTVISSILMPNEILDDIQWCGSALRIVLTNLLGQRVLDAHLNGVVSNANLDS